MSSKLVFAFAIYAAHGAIEHAGIVSSVSERGARSIIGKRHFAGIGANVVVTEINNANDVTAFFARFDRNAESFPICARKAEREFLSDYVALQANDSRFVPVTETAENVETSSGKSCAISSDEIDVIFGTVYDDSSIPAWIKPYTVMAMLNPAALHAKTRNLFHVDIDYVTPCGNNSRMVFAAINADTVLNAKIKAMYALLNTTLYGKRKIQTIKTVTVAAVGEQIATA